MASDPADPTLTINDQINNVSGIDWSGFVLDVYMGSTFSLSLPSSPVANPLGWSGSIDITPYEISSGMWMGEITFTGGTPVSADPSSPNNILNFSYQISFAGSTSYSFTEQLTVIPVPEPSSASLVGFGGVLSGLLTLVWRFRRQT